MKTKNLYVPLSMTAALAGLVACAVSCAKKSGDTAKPVRPPETAPVKTISPVTNALPATNTAALTNVARLVETPALTNAPVPEITNAPPAETAVKAPEPNEIAETKIPGHLTVVEMPTNPPAAPLQFFPASAITNAELIRVAPATGEGATDQFSLTLRAGYEHINHGDNNEN
jgi:hypothetical protein